MLVGALDIVPGIEEPPSLGRTLPPSHHTTGPEAKVGEIAEPESFRLGKAKMVPAPSIWFLNPPSSSPSRDYLHFLLKQTSKRTKHLLFIYF